MKSIIDCRYLLLSLLFVLGSVSAQENNQKPTVADFNRAYQAYQKAMEEGDPSEAVTQARRAVELGEPILEPGSKNLAGLYRNLGNALFQVGQSKEAQEAYEKAIAVYRDHQPVMTTEIAATLMDIARAHLSWPGRSPKTRIDNAQWYAEKALAEIAGQYSKLSVQYGEYLLLAGQLLMAGNPTLPRIEKFLYGAYQTFEKMYGDEGVRTGIAAYHLGDYYLARALNGDTDKQSDAGIYLEKALKGLSEEEEVASLRKKAYGGQLALAALAKDGEAVDSLCQTLYEMDSEAWSPENPSAIKRVQPVYPQAAADGEIEGKVIVEFDVDTWGLPRDIQVAEGENLEYFEQPALDAVSKWRFLPQCSAEGVVSVEEAASQLTFKLQ